MNRLEMMILTAPGEQNGRGEDPGFEKELD
jgi:hypothetical protein